ncbi:MAG: hypothetical protein A3E78_00615 [Alphaproteobacteria bacterium RIFCSPHIGHO2_12_FULL_63_12]|nr:MAG: hypothetical protein A3E78_00615 [Alphaproteobacteria bacterium RIFCSPHIGHO2_12_FULL_63_12]
MKKSIGIVGCVWLAGGAALAGSPNSAALEKFERTGETVSCVSLRSADITPVDESTLLVRVGSAYYVNDLRDKCGRIDDNFTRIDLRTFSNQLCSGEIVKVVHQSTGAFLGACSLGAFEKLRKIAPDAAPPDDR